MQEQYLDQAKVQAASDSSSMSIMPDRKDFDSFLKSDRASVPNLSNLSSLQLLGSLSKDDLRHDFAAKQPESRRDSSVVAPPPGSERVKDSRSFENSSPRNVETKEKVFEQLQKLLDNKNPGISEKDRAKMVEKMVEEMSSPRPNDAKLCSPKTIAPEPSHPPFDRHEIGGIPEKREIVNNMAEIVAKDIFEKGNINLLSKLIAMGAKPQETVDAVNKALEKAGSPLRVKAFEAETRVCFGEDQGSYRKVSISLHGKDGKLIQSETPVDDWANRKQSSGRSR